MKNLGTGEVKKQDAVSIVNFRKKEPTALLFLNCTGRSDIYKWSFLMAFGRDES